MASGNFSGYILDGHYRLQVNWSESDISPVNNTSLVTISCYLINDWDLQAGDRTISASINGVAKSWTTSNGGIHGTGTTYLGGASQTVTHNSDGSKSCAISATYPIQATISGTYYANITASATVTLDTIPRYATISQSVSSKTETSITMDWTTDSTVDKLWYSTNNGTNWTSVTIADGTSGTYTIKNLSEHTSYDIKTRVRRKDSQLNTDSSKLTVTTYYYPYAKTMPDYTIGEKLKITLYNPLGRTVTVYWRGADNSEISGGDVSGTSISGWNSTTFKNFMYASIPNSASGTYKIKVVYGNVSTKVNTGGTYSANSSECKPTIGTVSYLDTNSTSTTITGDNQKIIQNKSTVRYTANSLTAKNSATVSSCKVAVNGNTYTLSISGSTATGGNATINSGSNVTATFTVTDSRGFTGTKTMNVTMLSWANPTGIITVQRQDNFYTPTTLKCDAQYSSLNNGNTITITYSASRADGGGSAITGSLSDNVASTVNLDNTYAWNITFTLKDRLNATTTYNVFLSRGMPIIYFDRIKSSVGINCFPKNNLAFDINEIEYALSDSEYLEIARILANSYATTVDYEVGTFVRQSNNIYECTTACTKNTWSNNSSKFTLLGSA